MKCKATSNIGIPFCSSFEANSYSCLWTWFHQESVSGYGYTISHFGLGGKHPHSPRTIWNLCISICAKKQKNFCCVIVLTYVLKWLAIDSYDHLLSLIRIGINQLTYCILVKICSVLSSSNFMLLSTNQTTERFVWDSLW